MDKQPPVTEPEAAAYRAWTSYARVEPTPEGRQRYVDAMRQRAAGEGERWTADHS